MDDGAKRTYPLVDVSIAISDGIKGAIWECIYCSLPPLTKQISAEIAKATHKNDERKQEIKMTL